MPLDLQPVDEAPALDLQPVGATLDLQPVSESPQIVPSPPLTDRGRAPFIQPTITEEPPSLDQQISQMVSGARPMPAVTGTDADAQYKQVMRQYGTERMKQIIQTPLWDYLPGDMKAQIDIPGQMAQAAAKARARGAPDASFETMTGVAGGAANVAKALTTPLGIATLGTGSFEPAMQKAISLAFSVDMARNTPEIAHQLGAEMGKPDDQRDRVKIAQLITQGVANTGFSALAGAHGISPARPKITVPAAETADSGGFFAQRPNPAVRPITGEISEFGGEVDLPKPLDLQPVEPLTKGQANAVNEVSEQAGVQPERANGNESGQTAEAGGGNRLQRAAPGEEVAQPLQESPAGAAAGASNLAALSAIEQKYLNDALVNREPLDAATVDRAQATKGFALPQGYERAGDQYIYSEPAAGETPAARMAREQSEAMAALRTQAAEPIEGAAPPSLADLRTAEQIRAEMATGVPLQTFERPPDVLDDIENHVGGVRIPDAPDFDEHRAAVKELSQSKAADLSGAKLKGLFRGEDPDTALTALHQEGLQLNVENGEQLLDKMIGAARGRVSWAEGEKAAANFTPEADDPWQATIDKINSLKLDTNGQLHAFGLLPEAWNRVLDLVNLGVRGGKALSEAIDWAIAKFKGEAPGVAFDEASARQHILSTGVRATGEKLAESPAISDPVKTAVSEYLYNRRTNATDQETADGLLKQFGVDKAEQIYRDPPASMAGAVRSKLLGSVTRELAGQERVARASGDGAGAEALAQRQAKLWNDALPQITDMAQSLQALNDLIDMSPDGHVARARQRLDQAAGEAIDARRTEVEQVRNAIENGRQAGIEAVRKDPQVNGAARAAVDEAIQKNPETHKAVIMELAGPWSESPEIVRMAREQVRSKADELLNRNPQPKGLQPSQYLRNIMDDLSKRAAGIAATYFQGGVTHPGGLAGLLKERLGLDDAHAGRLAKSLNDEFDRQVKAAEAKLPKRIANMRATRLRNAGMLPTAPDTAVDAAIRRQLSDLNLKLGDVIRQEASSRDGNGQHVAERIVKASGLTGEAADTFRTRLQNRWDTLVTAEQQKALRALEARSGTSLTRPMKDAFTKLVELDRISGVTPERFQKTVRDSLKLPELSDEDAKTLRSLVQKAQEQPEGFLRERAAANVLQFTEKLTGQQRWWDVPMAIFYANVLSGFTTPAKIAFENTNLLVGNTLSEFLSRPAQNVLHPVDFMKQIGKAYGRGLAKGGLQAESTLRTGVVTGVWERGRTNVLESKPFGRFEPLNFWKYFTRVIGTAHELTFKPAWEVKQTMIARDVAQREGLRGKALDQRVADLLANTREQVESAKGQALSEMTQLGRMTPQAAGESTPAYLKRRAGDTLDLARRTREIIEQQREANLPGSTAAARDFAMRTAYLNEPYGYLGLIAKGVRSVLEQGRSEFPVTGTLAKTQIPFTTVVANILNEKLNWTPVGLARAIASEKTGQLYGRAILDNNERSALYAKSILGTVAVGAMAEMFGNHIHGNGPAAPEKRRQLLASGWIPHSVEYNGRYYSYMNTPAALSLAVIGNLNDWHRYGKGDDAGATDRAAFAAKATANAIVSQGMLDSLRRFFEALGDENTSQGGDKLEKLAARTGVAFVIPNAVQQVDRLFDPQVYDQTGMKAMLQSQVPFVRREGKPVLNVLGDPIQSGPFHYWASQQSADPLWRTLIDKQAFVPEPSRSTIVGNKQYESYRAITPDEYYNMIAGTGPQIRTELTRLLPTLQKLPPKEAQAVVAKVADTYHSAWKAQLRP